MIDEKFLSPGKFLRPAFVHKNISLSKRLGFLKILNRVGGKFEIRSFNGFLLNINSTNLQIHKHTTQTLTKNTNIQKTYKTYTHTQTRANKTNIHKHNYTCKHPYKTHRHTNIQTHLQNTYKRS